MFACLWYDNPKDSVKKAVQLRQLQLQQSAARRMLGMIHGRRRKKKKKKKRTKAMATLTPHIKMMVMCRVLIIFVTTTTGMMIQRIRA